MDAGNIQITLLDTVLALSAGLDLTRVKYPFHHRQTAYISWHLGKELGLSPPEMEELLVSALLHDSAMLWGEEEEVEEIYRPTTIRVYRHAIMGYLLMSDYPLLTNFFPLYLA